MELDQLTEIIKTSIKNAYDKGFVDGSTKQAILEIQGRDRFLEKFRASQPAVAADGEGRRLDEKKLLRIAPEIFKECLFSR